MTLRGLDGVLACQYGAAAHWSGKRERKRTMDSPLTHGLHHLGLTVSDLNAARDFFTDALGFQLLGEDVDYPSAFVKDEVVMITLWGAEPDATPFNRRKQVGLHHAAFAVKKHADLETLQARLKSWPGVTFDSEISAPRVGSDARHFLIRMPGGPRLEFFAA